MSATIQQHNELDVSRLPTYAYGNRSLMWWGTLGMILIESTVFALALVTYFYLRERSYQWPPHGIAPALIYGTLNTFVLLVSLIPNQWTKKMAEQENLRGVRIGLTVCALFSVAVVPLQRFEIGSLHTS